jgi:hypothetical protein
MMNISGPSNVGIIDQPSNQPLQLRVNQRVVAEILKVSGDQVTMVVQGTQVVGRLMAGEQSAQLADRRMAQFIVRGMVDGQVELQIARQEIQAAQQGMNQQWLTLAKNLLQLNGMAVNDANLTISQALLNRGLPVTPDLMNELSQALGTLGQWGSSEAELAAALKANGLPLTNGTLSLALQRLPSVADSLLSLQASLGNWLRANANSSLSPLGQRALQVLQQAMVQWGDSPADMMEQLPEAVSVWGKSLEAEMADSLKSGHLFSNNPADENGLVALAHFRRELAASGNNRLVGEIDKFMDSVRQMQFFNASQMRDPTNPPWLVMNIPLAVSAMLQNPRTQNLVPANLRVAYQPENSEKSIDPQNTRLIISVDINEGQFLQVDLSMIGHRVGAWMTASDQDLRQLVEAEMPGLKDGLGKLGYNLEFARCEVGSAIDQTASGVVETIENYQKINIGA